MKKIIILLGLLIFLKACSSYNKDLGMSLDLMYSKALHALSQDKLEQSRLLFQKISDEYPYKEEAIEAQVFLIWIYYLQNDYTSVEINIDSFLKYYVYNDYTPWVNYMSALVKYEQISAPQRDQSYIKDALVAFFNIMRTYQNSPYGIDAKLRLDVIKYNFAQRNLEIGRYYLQNRNYIAAISRFQEIIKNYSDTVFIQEALYRLTYLWLVLGVPDEAFRFAATLGYNYPNSLWYSKAENLILSHTAYTTKDQIKRAINANK
ncbi:outer membrane protein assembly factor BamD [Candidatus Hepatincolaceae symbiont of Richtersius coronifer]